VKKEKQIADISFSGLKKVILKQYSESSAFNTLQKTLSKFTFNERKDK